MPFGNDLKSKLESSIVYSDPSVDANGIRSLVIKFNFDPKDFYQLTNHGNDIESGWLSHLVYKLDSSLDPNKPVKLINRTVKDSVFDSKPVLIIIIKYQVSA